jgi:DNA-binding SARP family transcriptional activator/tetratricopeptide (TPR) repeat protein
MGEQLRVCVLGGLHLAVGGRPLVELTSLKARALLAYLAVTGAAQSRSALAGLLWSDLPEEAARTNLRVVLAKLRRVLPDHLQVTRQSVALAADQGVWVDALEVERLAGVGSDRDPDEVLAAVELCRRDFLDGVEVPGAPLFEEWAATERAGFRAAMLGVLDRAVRLARDRGDSAAGTEAARRLLTLEPLYEEAHRALMWFLARGGQPSAALAQYERCRSLLAQELGAEPSPATLTLREEILRAGGFVELGPSPSQAAGVGPAGPPVASLPVPRELPSPPVDFTGRAAELATLLGLLDLDASNDAGTSPGRRGQPVVISAIDGMGGIGKSALAIQVANQLADRFPDGQLYVNLHGATPGHPPLPPLAALGQLLRSLGVDPATIPLEVDEAAARWRSLAADRRLLVVLDNARDSDQVRPLLPASPTCAVLVTSRQVLAALDGTQPVHLDVLPPDQAVELLGKLAGPDRISAEPAAAEQVVGWCGQLPLAIRIAGARLAARPAWPVSELARRLRDTTRRLEELAVDGLGVRAAFDVSVAALEASGDPIDQAAARAFGLLSLPDGPDVDVDAAARLLDHGEPTAQTLLERLVDAHLLETPRPGRYQFHDLVRLHARRHATGRYREAERLAALERLVGFYTATAWHTLALLRPGHYRLATADPRWTSGGRPFPDDAAALVWLEAERANLLAAIAQTAILAPAIPPKLATELTCALFGFFQVRGHWADWVQANQTALALARRIPDRAAQAHALNDLGAASWRLGRYPAALDHLQQALTLYREVGDRHGQADSLHNLSAVFWRLGRYPAALDHLQQALTLYREVGDRHGQARSLGGLGVVFEGLGRYPAALDYHGQALTLFRELGDRDNQATSLGNLGLVFWRLGRYPAALDHLEQSLTLFREVGDRHGQADSLHRLGVVSARLGRYPAGLDHLQQALTLFRELGDRHGQVEALRDLGDALRGTGRHEQAREAWQEALALGEALQIPEADEVRSRLAALPDEPDQPTSSGIPGAEGSRYG